VGCWSGARAVERVEGVEKVETVAISDARISFSLERLIFLQQTRRHQTSLPTLKFIDSADWQFRVP
jgi:hypothetical protein